MNIKIIELRNKYNFNPADQLKSSTGSCPSQVTRQDHAKIKNEILSEAARLGVKACCYIVPHKIAQGKPKDERLKFAVNTVIERFSAFLNENSNDFGMVQFDHTTDYKQNLYFKELMQNGVPMENGKRILLPNVLSINSTQDGLSHLNSLCDIVVGSLRFVFNEPDKNIVGEKLFKLLSKLLWSETSKTGKTRKFRDKGLIIRPKTILSPAIKADIEATIKRLVKYSQQTSS